MEITRSERLTYRTIGPADFDDLKQMLADPRVMYAWEHTFSDGEILEWIGRQEECCRRDGVGYFAAVDRSSGELVGQIGLHRASYPDEAAVEVCYMLKYRRFHRGYAGEGVRAMLDYAFARMGLDRVYAQIKTDNDASVKVAERAGFVRQGEFIKRYRGKDMPHYLYVKEAEKEAG